MGIGRIVREIERKQESEKNIMVSVFYPSSEQTQGKYIDLFSPSISEAVAILKDMGADEEYLKELSVNFQNDATLNGEKSFPVVIFSPGIGVDRDFYIYIIEGLVAAGFVVITIGHVFDTIFTVMIEGNFHYQDEEIRTLDFTNFNALNALLQKRKADMITVLESMHDWNINDPILKGLFDLSKIIGVGHSLGGATVLEASRDDNRIKACVSLDGSLHLIKQDGSFQVPLLNLRQDHASYNEMKESMQHIIAKEYAKGQEYLYSNSSSNTTFAKVKNADHMSFSDVPILFKQDNFNSKVHIYIAETVTKFLSNEFKVQINEKRSIFSDGVKSINQYGEVNERVR